MDSGVRDGFDWPHRSPTSTICMYYFVKCVTVGVKKLCSLHKLRPVATNRNKIRTIKHRRRRWIIHIFYFSKKLNHAINWPKLHYICIATSTPSGFLHVKPIMSSCGNIQLLALSNAAAKTLNLLRCAQTALLHLCDTVLTVNSGC
jgi:hypothetical protein